MIGGVFLSYTPQVHNNTVAPAVPQAFVKTCPQRSVYIGIRFLYGERGTSTPEPQSIVYCEKTKAYALYFKYCNVNHFCEYLTHSRGRTPIARPLHVTELDRVCLWYMNVSVFVRYMKYVGVLFNIASTM